MLIGESKFNKKKIEKKISSINNNLKSDLAKVKKLVKTDKKIDVAKREFRKIINTLYRKRSDDINEDVVSIFEIIRMSIFIGLPFCINPALGLLSYLVDKLISEKVNEKSEGRVMGHVNRSIKLCEERLEQDLTDEERKNVEKMLSDLKRKKSNLENYYMTIKDYKNKAEDENSYDDDDLDSADDWGL